MAEARCCCRASWNAAGRNTRWRFPYFPVALNMMPPSGKQDWDGTRFSDATLLLVG